MKAVILCGGTGSRLRPLTEVRPKPLIRLLNVPVIETIIGKLTAAGITDIYLSLGYMAQEIISACDHLSDSAELHFCEEVKPLGTAGGVKNCISVSDEAVLVVSGDNIFDFDIRAAADFHDCNSSSFTVIGKYVSDPREYGCIVCNDSNEILSFIEKPNWENADSYLINTGMYIMDGSILDMIPENRFFDFADDLFPLLLNDTEKRFLCRESSGIWGDIGEFGEYIRLSSLLLREYEYEFPALGTLILHNETDENGNRILAPCLIGRNAQVGQKNTIGPCAVIGNDVNIGSGCSISGAVIGDRCAIGDGSDITDAIVDDNVNIGANCVIEPGAVIAYGAEIGKFSRLLAGVKIWPGKTIISESVINKDMFYETPASLEFDIFGISGKIYSQFTLSDVVKIGQAVASVKGTRRIGVSCDGKDPSSVYRELLCAGILSCGVSCYDFDESFMAQSYFYSAYCELDAFIYVSSSDDIVNLSFFGKNGMPVSARDARLVNNNYRFSAFSYASPEKTGVLYRMSLLSTAYSCSLQKIMHDVPASADISVECENEKVKNLLENFFSSNSGRDHSRRLQLLINPLGTDMYCIENDRFYSSDRIRSVLCELEFAAGNDVLIPENASQQIEKTAEKYGRKAIRVYDGAYEQAVVSREEVLVDLWNFDALHLCAKLINVLLSTNMTLDELCSMQEEFSIRSRIIEIDCAPSEIRNIITGTVAADKKSGSVYYDIHNPKGGVRLRQLGNTNRIRMFAEAADMETAKEIISDISGKIASCDIDNKRF